MSNDLIDTLDIPLPDQFNGLRTLAVGGVVRALFTNNPVTDVDLMVQGSTVEAMVERDFQLVVSGQTPEDFTADEFHQEALEAASNGDFFEFIEQIDGNQFPVFLDELGREVALARTERSTGDGHTNFDVVATPDVTVEEDLGRRDLTCNALAVDLTSGDLIDPFDGQQDIENEIIRHVGEDSFRDDPLRILRMARFAARLDFEVADETLAEASRHVEGLHTLPNERWGMEVVKAMKQAQQPSRFFTLLDTIDALETVLPELAALQDVPAGPPEHHQEGDAFEHTMLVLDEMSELRPGEPRALLGAMAHDLGKALTPNERLPSHPKHHVRGVDLMENIQNRLVLSSELRGVMESASRFHMRMHRLDELRDSTLIRMVDRLRVEASCEEPKHLTFDELIDLAEADSQGRVPAESADREMMHDRINRALQVLEAVGGDHIAANFEPNDGEHFGELLLQERIRAFRNPDEFGLTP